MTDSPLTDVEACVFDAYGTLLDVHSAVARHADDVGPRYAELSAEWRRRQLEYTWLRSLMLAFTDFESVTREALDVSLKVFDLDTALIAPLMQSYRSLDAFADVPGTLAVLGQAGFSRSILSNGTEDMLAEGVRAAGIEQHLDNIYSVDAVRIYKPDPAVYQLCVDRLGVSAQRVLFMSSNAWDAAGAAHFGFQVVWINRYGQPAETLPGKPVRTITSLDALPGIVGIC